MCVEPTEHQLKIGEQGNVYSDPLSVTLKTKMDSDNGSELHHINTSMPLRKYYALITNGSEQLWLEELVVDELEFRDYLNVNFPFFICLFCKGND